MPAKKYHTEEERRAADREKIRKWREANPDKHREHHRKYRKANHEKRREYFRKYREVNRENRIEYMRKYHAAIKLHKQLAQLQSILTQLES